MGPKPSILIIGASGFVGSYIKTKLENEYQTKFTYSCNYLPGGIKYDGLQDRLLDITALDSIDAIINCYSPAAEHSLQDVFRANSDLINFVKERKSWIINVSSISALYENRFNDQYSFKKFLIDELLQYELEDSQYSILQFPQIFDYLGKGQKSQSGFYYLVNSIINNAEIKLFKNNSSLIRSYLPVELVVKAVEYTISKKIKGVHSVLIPEFATSLEQLIHLLKIASFTQYPLKMSTSDKIGSLYKIPALSPAFLEWKNEAQNYEYYLTNLFREYRQSENV